MGKQVGRLSIRVLPDATRFREDLKLMIKRVETSMAVNLKVVADTREAELTIARFRTGESVKKIDMRVTASTVLAKAQLAALARNRFTTITVNIAKSSIANVQKFFAAISGGRLAHGILKDIREVLLDLDKSVPTIGRWALGIASLSSVLLTSSAGIITLTGDLLKMGNAGLLLPAMFAGLAVGMVTLVAALKDGKKQLATLAPAFHDLQNSISANFWDSAKKPIISFVQSVLPQLRSGFASTATGLGLQAAGLANAFKATFANGVLTTMFDRLRSSIDIVTGGTGAFASAVTTLGLTGSAYLPRFATWVTSIGEKFNTWVTNAAMSGELDRIINDGITQIKLFGDSIGSIVGIFRGLDAAATAAGGGGLASFAEKMKAARDTVNSSGFQTALTTILGGASAAMSGIGGGFLSLGSALQVLAPTISTVLTDAGAAIGGLITNISDAMKSPAFQKGLGDLFAGLKTGIDGLKPGIGPLVDLIGQLGSTVGTMAATFGPLLGTLKEVFAPVLDGLIKALTPLIPMIGGALTNAFGGLLPMMQGFGGFLQDNAGLVQGFALGLGGIVLAVRAVQFGTFIAGWLASTAAMLANKAVTLAIVAMYAKDLVVALAKGAAGLVAQTAKWIANTAAQIASKVAMVAGAVATGIATAAQWAYNVALLANPLVLIIVGIVALVAAIVWFFTQTKLGQQIWGNFVKFLSDVWNNIVNFIQDAVANIIGWVSQNWGLLLSLLIGPLGLVIQWIVENWSGIVQFFADVWNGIVAYVTTSINLLLAIIVAIGAAIAAVWNAIWNGIVAAVQFVWALIVGVVTTYINLVAAVFSAVGGVIAAVWNAIWNGIIAVVQYVWNGIVSGVAAAIGFVLGIITAVGATISGIWNGLWGGLGKVVSGAWSTIQGLVRTIVGGISGMIGDIGKTLGDIPGVIGNAFANAGKWLFDAGKKIIGGLIDGIRNMIGAAGKAAGDVMGAIANFFPHSPAKEGPFSGRGWTPYSGAALVDGLAVGMMSRVDQVRAAADAMMNAASGTIRMNVDDPALYAGTAAASGGSGDTITVLGNVGYDPQQIANELALKKRQAAMRNGVTAVTVK